MDIENRSQTRRNMRSAQPSTTRRNEIALQQVRDERRRCTMANRLVFRERYINQNILNCLSRPQQRWGCSLAAITCVINYLYSHVLGIQTQEGIAKVLGLSSHDPGSPGNQELIDWFNQFTRKKRSGAAIHGTGEIKFHADNIEPFSEVNEKVVRAIKNLVHSRRNILVYHLENHYNLVCGYFESAKEPTEAFSDDDPLLERWIVLGDHYPLCDPVSSTRWRDIRADFLEDNRHCFILFSRPPTGRKQEASARGAGTSR